MWQNREKLRFINYTERDFQSLKFGLRDYVELYFPGEIRNFATGTSSDIFLNINAYVADILHFYIDKQFSELFLDRAIELKNVYGIAKNLGYQPKGYRSAVASLDITVDFPATGVDLSVYKFQLPKFSQFAAGLVIFETKESIVFDATTTGANVIIQEYLHDDNTIHTKYVVTNVKVISGVTKTFDTNVDDIDYFPTIIIPDQKISEIISVVDREGNEYEDVKNLSQQAKYVAFNNEGSDSELVPYVISAKRVPYRYVFDLLSDGHMRLTFGNSEGSGRNESYIPSFSEFIDDNKVNGKFSNFNPSDVTINNLTRTNTLGVRPASQLTITYRITNGIEDNVSAGTIVSPINLDFQWFSPGSISTQERLLISRSLRCSNSLPAAGGRAKEGIDAVRSNASLHFSAQDRVVTVEDYYTRVMSLPPEYGKFEKIAIKRGYNRNDDLIRQLRQEINDYFKFTKDNRQEFDKIDNIRDIYEQKKSYDQFFNITSKTEEDFRRDIGNIFDSIDKQSDDIIIYCLSIDRFGKLIKSPATLKDNAQTYLRRFTPVSTTIRFEDANIINVQVSYQVKADLDSFEPETVLANCYNKLVEEFATENMQIGKNIVRTKIIELLHGVAGVQAVPLLEFEILNLTVADRVYSNDVIIPAISRLYTYNGSVISCPSNAIFELKYPKYNIIGNVV
jgi:hypothetical protein